MRRRRSIVIGAALIITVAAGVIIAIAINNVPETSQVVVGEGACQLDVDADQCIRFPTISGDNLPGQTLTLPDDFEGDYQIVVIPFDRDQQVVADTWLPFARSLAEETPLLRYYNVPIFPDLSDVLRLVVQTGMNVAIRDSELREITILVYLEDRDVFVDAMHIPDVEQIQVFLLNANAEVVWRGAGEFTEALRSELEQALKQAL